MYASVAAGIRCDVRNNDVLPPYMSSIKFTTPKTTLFRYNIEPKTIIHIPFHSSLCFPKFSLPFSLFLAIQASCNIYIVMFVILVHCPLPGSSLFFRLYNICWGVTPTNIIQPFLCKKIALTRKISYT